MNILVIGNGFDLAHGFPTTYKNFLEFTDVFKRYIPICKKEEIEPEEIHIKDREKVMFLHDLTWVIHGTISELITVPWN